MPDYRDLLQAFRDQTALTPEAADRLRGRLGAPSPRRPVWPAAMVATALAAAAVLVSLRPPPPVAGPLVTGPLTTQVQLQVDGDGQASGDARDLTLDWRIGTLQVEVRPNQGVQLRVQTDEATVRVIGTGFQVTRDALGTSVDVRHGQVLLTCLGAAPEALGAGQTRTCAPARAAGRLGRVRRLQELGLAPAYLLAEADAALRLPDASGTVQTELQAVRLDALVALDQRDDALALAEALARQGGPRQLDAHRVAARLRLARGPDCAGALPHLQALAAAGRLEDDAPWLTICDKESRP